MAKTKEEGGIPISFATTDELVKELQKRWKGGLVLGMIKSYTRRKSDPKGDPHTWLCHVGHPIMLLGLLELLHDNVLKTRFKTASIIPEGSESDE